MKTMTDTNGNPLIPGHVYAAMTYAYCVLNNGELNDTGIFVVCGEGGKLYDCDSDEPTEIHPDCFDALVEQTGSFMPEYAERATDCDHFAVEGRS
jgi:hypothetical protein